MFVSSIKYTRVTSCPLCIFVWYFAGKLGERSRREKIPASKMRKGLLFAKRSWKDGETEGVQIFFVNYFSPAAKWCGPEGNSYSALSWGWNLWVFFLERKTKFEWEKKNSKIRPEGLGQHHPSVILFEWEKKNLNFLPPNQAKVVCEAQKKWSKL